MDIIFIEDLRIETIIGIFAWERKIKQIVSLNIEMGTDIRAASFNDSIDFAIDYKSVSDRLISFVEISQFQLIETMAEKCANIILQEYGVSWVRLRVNKLGAIAQAKNVGVMIERGEKL